MSDFYAILSRMKYINRWGLMNNTRNENLSEHSLEVAIIAHSLALIGKNRLNKDIDANKVAVIAMFHDSSEIITGDMPTPIKYKNKKIQEAYKDIEKSAQNKLVEMLPDDLREDYDEVINIEESSMLYKYVKSADKISALIKCIEEMRMGNMEFAKAKQGIEDSIMRSELEEVKIFIKEMLPSYSKTLDEITL